MCRSPPPLFQRSSGRWWTMPRARATRQRGGERRGGGYHANACQSPRRPSKPVPWGGATRERQIEREVLVPTPPIKPTHIIHGGFNENTTRVWINLITQSNYEICWILKKFQVSSQISIVLETYLMVDVIYMHFQNICHGGFNGNNLML